MAMASANGNGATGTSKGHEQASGIGQKVQDFAQKAMGAAGATMDKTVRLQTCTQCCTTSGRGLASSSCMCCAAYRCQPAAVRQAGPPGSGFWLIRMCVCAENGAQHRVQHKHADDQRWHAGCKQPFHAARGAARYAPLRRLGCFRCRLYPVCSAALRLLTLLTCAPVPQARRSSRTMVRMAGYVWKPVDELGGNGLLGCSHLTLLLTVRISGLQRSWRRWASSTVRRRPSVSCMRAAWLPRVTLRCGHPVPLAQSA